MTSTFNIARLSTALFFELVLFTISEAWMRVSEVNVDFCAIGISQAHDLSARTRTVALTVDLHKK